MSEKTQNTIQNNSSPHDDENIIPNPEQGNNIELVDDLIPIDDTSKGKDIENYNNTSDQDSDSEYEKYIHVSQQEEWRRQLNTVKFSVGISLSVAKGTTCNAKIQTIIDKLKTENSTWIDYITTPKRINNTKEIFFVFTFPSKTELEKAKFIKLEADETYLKQHKSLCLTAVNFSNQEK